MEDIVRAKSEYEQLKEKLRQLRAEVSALRARRDDLVLRECPRIKAEYNARIGALKLRVFDAQNRILQLRRAIEILQAARNRQEQKDAGEAQRQAQEEYRRYENDLKKKAEDVKNSQKYQQQEEERERQWQDAQDKADEKAKENGTEADQNKANRGDQKADGTENGQKYIGENTGAGDDTRQKREKTADDNAANDNSDNKKFKSRAEELRYYYRLLVKRLHPDSNPNQTPEEAELLQQVMRAYKDGDLDKLKEIYENLKGNRSESEFQDTPEDIGEMKKIIAELEVKKNSLLSEIERIENSYPYRWKELLENEKAVEAVQQNLANELRAYEKQYQELQKRFDDLKNGREPA